MSVQTIKRTLLLLTPNSTLDDIEEFLAEARDALGDDDKFIRAGAMSDNGSIYLVAEEAR